MEKASRLPETVVKIEATDLPSSSSPEPSSPSETRGKRITVQLLSSTPSLAGLELVYDGNRDAMALVDHGKKSCIVAEGWISDSPASGVRPMRVSDTGERAAKRGHRARKVDGHVDGEEPETFWITGETDDEVLPAPVASMVQFALFFQQAQQRLNQRPVLRGGGGDEEDEEDKKPPKDEQSRQEELKKLWRKFMNLLWEILFDIECWLADMLEDEEEEEDDDWDFEDEVEFNRMPPERIDPNDFEPPNGYKIRRMPPYDPEKKKK